MEHHHNPSIIPFCPILLSHCYPGLLRDHHGRGKRLWSQSKVYDRAGTFPKFFGSPLPMCNPWKCHLWSFHVQTLLKIVGPGLRLIPNLVLRKFLTFNSKVRERLCWDDCLDGDVFFGQRWEEWDQWSVEDCASPWGNQTIWYNFSLWLILNHIYLCLDVFWY